MDHLVWSSSPVNNACRLAVIEGYDRSFDLLRGVPLERIFPREARARMNNAFKKATGLTDDLVNLNSAKICSKRLVEFLRDQRVEGVEYLPLTILDHKGKVASDEYFVVNPVGLLDALDRGASKPVYNAIDNALIMDVEQLVLDPRRLDPRRKVFRLAGLVSPVLIEASLADAMKALGFIGPYFKALQAYDL